MDFVSVIRCHHLMLSGMSEGKLTNHRKTSPRLGAAAVEFALLFPLLLIMFLVAVDFARIYRCTQIVADSARMGAMYLSNPDLSDKTPYATVQEAALACASNLSPPPTVTSRDGTDARGNRYYEVTVTYNFSLVSRALGMLSSMTIKRSVQARMYPAAVLEMES